MLKNVQKNLLLAAAALLLVTSLSACGGSKTSSDTSSVASTSATSSGATSSAIPNAFILDVTLIAYSTTNWTDFDALGDAKDLTATLNLPGTWVSDGPNLVEPYTVTEKGKDVTKYKLHAYVAGMVYLADGQNLPAELGDKAAGANGNVVSETSVTMGSRSGKLRICSVSDSNSDSKYRYEYYLIDDGKVIMISFYTIEKDNADDLALQTQILTTMTLKRTTAQEQAAASGTAQS